MTPRRLLAAAALLLLATPTLAQDDSFGRFDYGKMWTFDHPPRDYFLEAYGLEASDEWFERARLGALRIPGCSASFASPSGLVLTNHHCARAGVAAVAREDETLLDDGFVAWSPDHERQIPGFVADQLVDIVDVTDEVWEAQAESQTDAERSSAIQEATAAITERMQAEREEGHVVQVVSLYNGGLYSAYVFRRYSDIRLVMAPELQIGYFGGDSDNFTFPRYALDFSLLRVYHEGAPLETDYYFPWSETGVREGETVFAIGNPGSTFRLETVSQLEYRRDVLDAYVLNLIDSRLGAMERFVAAHPEASTDALRNQIFGLLNAQKLYRGRLKALQDAGILNRKAAAEAAFSERVALDENLNSQYGGLLGDMSALQYEQRAQAAALGAFLSLAPASGLSSATERRALVLVDYLDAVRDSLASAPGLRAVLASINDLPAPLEQGLLAARLRDFGLYFGGDDPLASADPEAAATHMLESSILDDGAELETALSEVRDLSSDPAVLWARRVRPRQADYQSAAAGLGARQQRLASNLGRARFDVYGTSVPPDATFSLRIADGVVGGYEYNGTLAPAFTTFFGMLDRHFSHAGDPEWALPSRWTGQMDELNLTTSVNFVSTADITGGNSGSPVVNERLELVGLIFDGNIESLSGDFIYLDGSERSVSVDVRGILEALSSVYEAGHLVEELTTGRIPEMEMQEESR